MRSIQATQRRSGRKVKNWWENPFRSHHLFTALLYRKQRTVPGIMELEERND